MSAYIVVDIRVRDPEGYAQYRAAVPPLVAQYGGRYLVRGGALEVMEGDWQPERLVVIEFPSVEQAKAFLHAPEYTSLRATRRATTDSNLVIVQGV